METFPLSNASIRAGVPSTQVRNWLDRKLVKLDANRLQRGRKHRRFTTTDIVRLALIGGLTRWGVTAKKASGIVEEILKSNEMMPRDVMIWFDERYKAFRWRPLDWANPPSEVVIVLHASHQGHLMKAED
jgi:DNA-binding transcriptional MerR regulator